MLLAFYVNQLAKTTCHIFIQIEKNIAAKVKLWNSIKAIFQTKFCQSMEVIYRYTAFLFQIKLDERET